MTTSGSNGSPASSAMDRGVEPNQRIHMGRCARNVQKVARKLRSRFAVMLTRNRVRYYRLMGVSIGKDCYVSSGACIDARRGKITIGDNVSISSGSYVLGHVGFRDLKVGQETVLEDNVKVFVNAVVLPGVRIGRNSIVGAGAVVGKDVPPNVLVMGNPARVVEHLDATAEGLVQARVDDGDRIGTTENGAGVATTTDRK